MNIDKSPAPFYTAIMMSLFGSEAEQAAAGKWLDSLSDDNEPTE